MLQKWLLLFNGFDGQKPGRQTRHRILEKNAGYFASGSGMEPPNFFDWANSQVLSVRCLARQPLDKKCACGKKLELPKIDRPCLKNGFEN